MTARTPSAAKSGVKALLHFPPPPRLQGRETELATLVRAVETAAPARLALVGAGGSGKSVLAAALGHALAGRFRRRVHWFRVGAWDATTLGEMLALRFGTSRGRRRLFDELRRLLGREERLLVLDNHEDDRAMARFLDALSDTKASFVITARRCLLGGVLVFPVTAPLVTSGESAFPRVERLTRRLRWNPLALDIADGIVASGDATVDDLAAFLDARGVGRVRVIDHEDDLPEVALLVEWTWKRLDAPSRRILGLLAHVEGDNVDAASIAELARVSNVPRALGRLERWRLVQEPMPGRYTVHAVVRHAVRPRTTADPDRAAEYYVSLLEADPRRLVLEQTHLFAAMDRAHRAGDLGAMLRIDRLLGELDEVDR